MSKQVSNLFVKYTWIYQIRGMIDGPMLAVILYRKGVPRTCNPLFCLTLPLCFLLQDLGRPRPTTTSSFRMSSYTLDSIDLFSPPLVTRSFSLVLYTFLSLNTFPIGSNRIDSGSPCSSPFSFSSSLQYFLFGTSRDIRKIHLNSIRLSLSFRNL